MHPDLNKMCNIYKIKMGTMQNSDLVILKIEEAISLINRARSILDELEVKVIGDENKTQKYDAANLTFNLELNPNYTFQNFIEGKSNKLARTVGFSIVEHPEKTNYNPFLVYSASGCGKSHLINAIGARYKELYPEKNVLYLSAHLFRMHFNDAILRNYYNNFMHFYQGVDMLIVDDIQDWNNAPNTLKAVFLIVNHLIHCGKRVILTCSCPPQELKGFNKNLLNCFSNELVIELEKPDIELCMDILNYKCHCDSLEISKEIIDLVATSANNSVCDLVNVYNFLKAYSTLNNSNIDMQLAKHVIERFVKSH